jgi:hypothetical protein
MVSECNTDNGRVDPKEVDVQFDDLLGNDKPITKAHKLYYYNSC